MHFGWLARPALMGALLGGLITAAGAARAEELNDKTVGWLTEHAFALLPDRFTTAEQKVIKIDHSKPEEYMVPPEAAREVIKIAYDSARAQICHLIEKQRDNYQAMLKHQQAAGKWNEKQLLYIKQLHLFVVQFSTGTIRLTQVGDNQKVEVIQTTDGLNKIKPCTDEEKKALADRIDAYAKG